MGEAAMRRAATTDKPPTHRVGYMENNHLHAKTLANPF